MELEDAGAAVFKTWMSGGVIRVVLSSEELREQNIQLQYLQ
jgi:hypothetical protein